MFSKARRWSPGWLGGDYQQEQDIDRLAIERSEVDPLARQRDGADQAIDLGVPRVWHGDSLTDAGRAQFFSVQDRAEPRRVLIGRGEPGRS